MDFNTAPAAGCPTANLVKLLNRGFEAYFIPIRFDTVTFWNMLHQDGIDLNASRILMVSGRPCGIALIARRGSSSRLAAMGITRELRGQGAGSWFMNILVRDAHQRNDRDMVLEVIEQNEPAVKLYRKFGFQTVRRLLGFTRTSAPETVKGALDKIGLHEMGQLVSKHGLRDLPWQLSGESIAQLNPSGCAYRKGPAYIAVSDLELEHVMIWSLLVEQEARGAGLGTDLLKSIVAGHASKTWHVPAILPEEFAKVFERAGFEREKLSQWQMQLSL